MTKKAQVLCICSKALAILPSDLFPVTVSTGFHCLLSFLLATAFSSRCLPSQPSLLPAYPLYWLLLFSFYVEHLAVYKSHWSIRMETNNHSMHQVMILVLILSPLSLLLAIRVHFTNTKQTFS